MIQGFMQVTVEGVKARVSDTMFLHNLVSLSLTRRTTEFLCLRLSNLLLVNVE